MTTKKKKATETAAVPLVSDEVLDELLTRADAQGTELLGPDGLLNHLTKAVMERALDEELSDHLGYDKHDPVGRGSGNSRNGTSAKVLLTEAGEAKAVEAARVDVAAEAELFDLLGTRGQADLRRLLDAMLDTYATVAARTPAELARKGEQSQS